MSYVLQFFIAAIATVTFAILFAVRTYHQYQ